MTDQHPETGDASQRSADESEAVTPAAPEAPADESAEPLGPAKPTQDVLLAVDIGGTTIAAGLVTTKGDLIDRDRLEIDHHLNAEALFDQLVDMLQPLLDRAKQRHDARVRAIGIATAGPVSGDHEQISPVNVPAWRGFPLRQRLVTVLRLPVHIELEARAMALAEGWLGAAVGRENFVALVVSTSLGGGVVLNGQLVDGASGNAGHFGHIIVEPNGRRCSCGSRGCLESEASGASIESITGRPATEPSYEIMQRTGKLVGVAMASVCNLLDIDLVVCGGPVAFGFGATFFHSAQDALTEHSRLTFSRSARIVQSRLGDKGPLVGAGAVAIRGLNRARRGQSNHAGVTSS